MKKSVAFLVLLSAVLFAVSAFAEGNHRVRGYWRDSDHDGAKDTYVAPHQSTNPDSSLRNNYGYPGNYNPNSGTITSGDSNKYENSHKSKNPYGW